MAGRPTDYDKDVIPSVRDYIDNRKSEGRVPSIEGLGVFLDVNRSTLYEWAKHHPAFSDILDALQSNQAEMLIDNGLNGKFNATITRMMLTKHGYKDASDITSRDQPITARRYSI
jgi:hypothetical protein